MNELRVLKDAEQLVDAIERAGRPMPPMLRERYEAAAAQVATARDAYEAGNGLGVFPVIGWLLTATGALTMIAAAVGITRGGYEVGEGVRAIAVGVRGAAETLGRTLRWALPIGVGLGAFMLARSFKR